MLITKKTAEKRGSSIYDGAGSAVSAFARRQMEKMGWTEGKGLGKREDGLSSHIKVAKKDDSAGLGVDAAAKEQVQVADNWWHDGFSKQLKAFGGGVLDGKKVKKAKKKKGEGDGGSGGGGGGAAPSYEELFAATGGARLGMRARAKQTGKIARAELGLAVALPVGDDFAAAAPAAASAAAPVGNKGVGKERKDGKKKKNNKDQSAAAPAANDATGELDATADAETDKEARRREKKEKRKGKRKERGSGDEPEKEEDAKNEEDGDEEGATRKKKRRKKE